MELPLWLAGAEAAFIQADVHGRCSGSPLPASCRDGRRHTGLGARDRRAAGGRDRPARSRRDAARREAELLGAWRARE
jgi:hypothetical protein